eukprot:13595023-Ditylum_brightwellii.AAC.1
MSSWVGLCACNVTSTSKKESYPRRPPRNPQAGAWPTLLPKSVSLYRMFGLFFLSQIMGGRECMPCTFLCMARRTGLWSPCGGPSLTSTKQELHLVILPCQKRSGRQSWYGSRLEPNQSAQLDQ